MAVAATTEQLFASCRRRAFVPTDSASWPDSDLLALMNEEMRDYLVPFILEEREGHLLYTPADTPLVAGQASYLIPSRAAGNDIYSVHLVDSSGGVTPALAPVEPEVGIVSGSSSQLSQSRQYMMRGNYIVLSWVPQDSSLSLRLIYPVRPSELVLSTAAALVTGIAGNVVTASGGVPTTITNSVATELVSSVPGYEALTAPAVSSATGTTITFASPPTGLKVGDYVCLADQAPVPTWIPADLLGLFAQRCALSMQAGRAEATRVNIIEKELERLEGAARVYLRKRDIGSHRKIVPRLSRLAAWARIMR